jgi:hypothetical protein
MPNLDGVYISMFCGRARHLDEIYFWRKRMEKRHMDYARNSYRDEFINFPSHSYSRASPRTSSHALYHFSHGPNYRSYGFGSRENSFCLDALVMTHILIVVITSHVDMVFLLEGLTVTLSPDTWTVYVFPVVVLVPLVQRLRCKRP